MNLKNHKVTWSSYFELDLSHQKGIHAYGFKSWERQWVVVTVCPGSSDPPEKILNIFASENEVYTSF